MIGACRFQRDGKIYFFHYNYVGELADGDLFAKLEDCRDYKDPPRNSTCNASSESVELFVDHIGGMRWAATACRACRQIKSCWDSEESRCYQEAPQWAMGLGIMKAQKYGEAP